MSLLGSYKNGNYYVDIFSNGTKIRHNDLDFFEAAFPESFDLKITNKCHNNCPYCHENSSCNGKHGSIMDAPFINNLHPYTEIAIGGGNPLEHPELIPFLEKLKSLKMIPSMTIRQNDFMDNVELLRKLRAEKLIYGLGISLVIPDEDFIKAIQEFPNAVIHVINGIVTIDELKRLKKNNLKILILGYKEVRRGADLIKNHDMCCMVSDNKFQLYRFLEYIIKDGWFDVVSFDNLAIKQLNPQRLMSKEQWDEMYMGDDGIDGQQTSASMFIDLVENKFARNSCAPFDERFPILDSVDEMYQLLKNYKKEVR